MLVEAKYLGKGVLETVQDAGHSSKIVNCKFQDGVTEPAIGAYLTIDDSHIIRGERDASAYQMRTPLSAEGEVITDEMQASKDQEISDLKTKLAAQESAAKDAELVALRAKVAATAPVAA